MDRPRTPPIPLVRTAASVELTGDAGGDLGGSYPDPTVSQARGLRETDGPTTLAVGSVPDGTFLQRSGTAIVGATAAAVVGAVYAGPPRPTHTVRHVVWESLGSTTSQSMVANTIRYVPHYEDLGATYDAIVFRHGSNAGAGGLAKLALYLADPSSHNPDELLWYGPDVDTSTAAVYTVTFSSGTFTTLGNTYKDGSSRLVLPVFGRFWKAWMRNSTGLPSLYTVGTPRPTGGSANMQTPFVGFSASRTYANGYPDPAASLVDETSNQPQLHLRMI
jgi:hypothetical protein